MKSRAWIVAATVAPWLIASCKSHEPAGSMHSFDLDGIVVEYTGALASEGGGVVTGVLVNSTDGPVRDCAISVSVFGDYGSFGWAHAWFDELAPGQRHRFEATWEWLEGSAGVGTLTCYRVLENVSLGPPLVASDSRPITRMPRVGERVLFYVEAVRNPETGRDGSVTRTGLPPLPASPREVAAVEGQRVLLNGAWVDWRRVVSWYRRRPPA